MIQKVASWSIMHILAVVCIPIGFILYGQTLQYEFVEWDDPSLITENSAVHGLSIDNIKTVFTTYDPELYIPLTLLSYQIEYTLVQDHPWLYHFTNILLHIACAVLVGMCIFQFYNNKSVALLTSILFLVHPLHSEVVSWASARKDLLSTVFFLGSFYCYLRFRNTKHVSIYCVSVALFVLGLLSKAMILTLPLILVLTEYTLKQKDQRLPWKHFVPYFVFSILFGVIALIGKQEKLVLLSVIEQRLMSYKSLTFILERIIAPHTLSALHPYYDTISGLSPFFLIPLLICFGLLVLTIALRKKQPWVSYCILFYWITLIPTSFNQTKGGDLILGYDRYAYLPSIGILLLMSILIFKLQKKYAITLAGFICFIFSAQTYVQSQTWQNTYSLFSNIANHYPESHVAQEHLGHIAMGDKRFNDAIIAYNASIEHRDDPAAGYINLGAAYGALGNIRNEQIAYQTAISIDPTMPHARYNLARLYEQIRANKEAKEQYKFILKSHTDFLDAKERFNAL